MKNVGAARQVEVEPEDWQERPVYWATISYVREWWSRDGLIRRDIARHGGLTPVILRSIALQYNFSRGILKAVPGRVDTAARLCRILNKDCDRWPDGLVDRAEHCLRMLERAMKQELFRKDQVSGMTKLMWFVRPDNWTLFDRFAAAGVGIGANGTTRYRMKSFYQELDDRNFSATAHEMQAIVDCSRVTGVPATRILDTFLMAAGERFGEDGGMNGCTNFLDVLPPETSEAVNLLATDLQEKVGASPFFSLPIN